MPRFEAKIRHCLDRAEEARCDAEELKDVAAKAMMLAIAINFEKVAKHLAEVDKTSPRE